MDTCHYCSDMIDKLNIELDDTIERLTKELTYRDNEIKKKNFINCIQFVSIANKWMEGYKNDIINGIWSHHIETDEEKNERIRELEETPKNLLNFIKTISIDEIYDELQSNCSNRRGCNALVFNRNTNFNYMY